MRHFILLSVIVALSACAETKPETASQATNDNLPEAVTTAAETTANTKSMNLAAVLAAQPEEVQARYVYRHPAETLAFFGIEPGMTVVEALPGGGWYSKLLLPYLGDDGALIGANYAHSMLKLFGFYSEERLKEMETWTSDWPTQAATWIPDNNTSISAFTFGNLPQTEAGSADAVLFVRALHNLARFRDEDDFLQTAITDAYTILKPGGVVGVVQHRMREEAPDAWAMGDRGYLKQSYVIEQMQQAGFVLEDSSELNANALDIPEDGDRVWRLPPTLGGSKDKPEVAAAMTAIGESNRMTLRFRKPTT
jgi:predicted methyltransferase